MSRAELIGYAAAACVFVTFYMKTMVPLRVAGIVSNMLFIAYAYDLSAFPVLILHLALLPLNIIRLRQMLNLIRQIEAATKDDANLDWVKPFSTVQNVRAGEVLFRQGDPAREMFFVVSGRFWVEERRVAIETGEVFGELGLLNSDQARTASVGCMEDGQLLRIGYDQVKQLYLQDPKFGFYFLHLVSKRLFHNLSVASQQTAPQRNVIAEH
jgi:CRP/FNR family transcriptional regulator, cyclic AMP receptor protein